MEDNHWHSAVSASWTQEQIDAAIRVVQFGSPHSINSIAREHSIPPTTLKDRLSGRVAINAIPGPDPVLKLHI